MARIKKKPTFTTHLHVNQGPIYFMQPRDNKQIPSESKIHDEYESKNDEKINKDCNEIINGNLKDSTLELLFCTNW